MEPRTPHDAPQPAKGSTKRPADELVKARWKEWFRLVSPKGRADTAAFCLIIGWAAGVATAVASREAAVTVLGFVGAAVVVIGLIAYVVAAKRFPDAVKPQATVPEGSTQDGKN